MGHHHKPLYPPKPTSTRLRSTQMTRLDPTVPQALHAFASPLKGCGVRRVGCNELNSPSDAHEVRQPVYLRIGHFGSDSLRATV